LSQRRALWLLAAAGLALFALSFVEGWIVHDREIRGEGYRTVQVLLSGWRGVAVPVASAAGVVALGVAVWASAIAVGRIRLTANPQRVGLIGSAVVVGLVAASAWPIAQSGHASSVRLSVGPLWPAVAVLALVMLGASVSVARPPWPAVTVALSVGVLALAGGIGGRWIGLQLAEGTGQHWEVGSYTRAATDGQPTETLTLDGTTYAIGDRWSGALESSGWTVILSGDPACPGVRGTYHAHGVDDVDLRFVKVVDPCAGGARAEDLQAGTWRRDR
jgi:hypothetical protein